MKAKEKEDIGKRKWHRVFGWGKITHPYTDKGKTLFDSEYKHIEVYTMGKGWIIYKGKNGGNITSIFLHKSELFDKEQTDKSQGVMHYLLKVIK